MKKSHFFSSISHKPEHHIWESWCKYLRQLWEKWLQPFHKLLNNLMKELCPLIPLLNTYFTWYGLGSLVWLVCSGFHHQVTENTYYIDAAAAKSLQSCPTLCNPIDGSPPGSPVPGILQARTPEWVAISFSNAWKWKMKVKLFSRVWLCRPHGLQPTRVVHTWDFPGKSTGVGCHCLLLSHFSCVRPVRPYRQQPTRLCRPCDSLGKITGVVCHFLLHGIFLTQGSNPGLLCCRWSPALQADSLPTKPPGKPC